MSIAMICRHLLTTGKHVPLDSTWPCLQRAMPDRWKRKRCGARKERIDRYIEKASVSVSGPVRVLSDTGESTEVMLTTL